MKKKVALLGNMNNFNYCIARYLRDINIDAHLFLGDEFEHFNPQSDDYEFNDFNQYIHQLDWHTIGHWKIKKEKIRNDLKGYDFIIATDRNIAYLYKAGIKINLFIPHGGDIIHLAFYRFKFFPPKRYEIGAWYQAYHQRKGIQSSQNILMDYMNKGFEDVFNSLNYKNNRIKLGFPAIYTPIYESNSMIEYSKQSSYVAKLKKFKERFDCIIFNNSRLIWTDHKTQQFHYKANDRLINAVANLVKKDEHKLGLVLFEYGADVTATKELVTQLGLDENVLWFNMMNRKEIIPLMMEADIVSSEFENSWIMGGVIIESMLTKKPLLAYRNDKDYEYYKKLYPMLNAKTQSDIEQQIVHFLNNREEWKVKAEEANLWFKEHFINGSLRAITDLIAKKE